jgi:hypothetical protein
VKAKGRLDVRKKEVRGKRGSDEMKKDVVIV